MAFAEVSMGPVITPLSMAYQAHGRGGSPSGPTQPNSNGLEVTLAVLVGSVMSGSGIQSIFLLLGCQSLLGNAVNVRML